MSQETDDCAHVETMPLGFRQFRDYGTFGTFPAIRAGVGAIPKSYYR
jgi:hypothetical protein